MIQESRRKFEDAIRLALKASLNLQTEGKSYANTFYGHNKNNRHA